MVKIEEEKPLTNEESKENDENSLLNYEYDEDDEGVDWDGLYIQADSSWTILISGNLWDSFFNTSFLAIDQLKSKDCHVEDECNYVCY